MPELNTTSTADISFMLLVFFLMTTSMDNTKGMLRQLPPPDNKETLTQVDVERKDLLTLQLTAHNQLIANDDTVGIDSLRTLASAFISEKGDRHVISLEAHPEATYDSYFQLQNQLMLAYRDARSQWTVSQYGRNLADCSQEQQASAVRALPQRIAEVYESREGGGS